MYATDLKRGTLVDGLRVIGRTVGIVNGHHMVTVVLDAGTRVRRGKRRAVTETRTYPANVRVPGTRRPTTHAMPAGLVRPVPEPMLIGKRFGRGSGESRGDFHARLMASVTYG